MVLADSSQTKEHSTTASAGVDDGAENPNEESEYTTGGDYSESTTETSVSWNSNVSRSGSGRAQRLRTRPRPNFAVQSIRRGSSGWQNLLKPFVSDLTFRSLVHRRFQSEVSFRPYTCHAAVLFVDLSNYSKISAALSHRGAHTLSSIVNAYLSRILRIISKHAGDVIKFAGDAVLVLWEGQEDELEINLLTAAKCVMELQESAGSHPVDGTDLEFRIHCGLTTGQLESEIFVAPVHEHMQRLFHSVGGNSMVEISELVDIAKQGEVCVSEVAASFLGSRGRYKDAESNNNGRRILTEIHFDQEILTDIVLHIDRCVCDRMLRRTKPIEEEFIHPSVIRLLSHAGSSPTQIAQMRNLCVLFIAMTSNGSSVNWLMEVQSILDKNRCPIVQIIDDDKGVHLVAAINLYESIPEASTFGLDVCRELKEKQVGCAIGMAQGSTFCGVTGHAEVACRWDVTGPPAVRAARLMQFALESDVEVAIDQSVYDDSMAATRLVVLRDGILLKGNAGSVPIYTLSSSKLTVAFRVLETVHGRVHDDKVKELERHICSNRSRVAVVVTGIPVAGKKIVCQRAAGFADLVPYLHVSDKSAGFLQLANTIATWFQYVENNEVRRLATIVLDDMKRSHWSRAHDTCVDLVDAAIASGLRACFLVDRIQFLDEFSLSLIRECLAGNGERRSIRFTSSRSLRRPKCEDTRPNAEAKICFLCVHVSLYNWKSASDVVQDMMRSQGSYDVPIIQLGAARCEELRTMFRDLSDMEVEDRWLDAYSESSGCFAGYFIERAAAVRVLSGKLWSQGKRALAETTTELVLHIPPGLVRVNKRLPVMQVRPELAMRFAQVFDELPPLFQTFAKVLTLATRGGFYRLPRAVMFEVLNDLIYDGVESGVFNILLDEMRSMCLLKIESHGNEDVLSFECPALSDVAYDVSLPAQVRSITGALIERLDPRSRTDFRVPLVLATLHDQLNHEESVIVALWRQGYESFMKDSRDWDLSVKIKWQERIDDEIRASGLSTAEVLGEDFYIQLPTKKVVGKRLPLLKIYSAPVALGPMGHSLSVITRNTFHEFSVFHGLKLEAAAKLRNATTSAAHRYLQEMKVLEDYLTKNGFPAPADELSKEREMIMNIAKPASSDDEVQSKAVTILDEYVPRFITTRLQRLHGLVDKLRQGEIPGIVQKAEPAIRRAYEALRAPKFRTDAAQDALMILATCNFKPKPLPEYLPLLHYQTVGRIRSKILRRLNDTERFIFKHQQEERDLEAFLIVTPLLYEASEK